MAALLAAGLVISAASAGVPVSAEPANQPRQPAARGAATTITLITGDQVHLSKQGKGYSVVATAAPGRAGVVFGTQRLGDSIWVFPNDAVGLVAAGRLDRRLFEVSALAAQGNADNARGTIPLVIQRSKGKPVMAFPAGAVRARELVSVNATAVKQDKKTATGFWTWLTGSTKSLPGRRSAIRGAYARNVGKVWLDGRVTAGLDRSVPQVGALPAWKEGYTGKGVKVAVLDTGIDSTHLDLKGAVAASENFSDSPGTVDRFGHGTHVASIITGSGARSRGRYKGVAPDAVLLNGKVLDDYGYGSDSAVVAGMEWAVANGARVVNMSLGGTPGEGPGLLDLALNELSRSSGALFVVAAGNRGPARYTVTTPATATEALSVAATNRNQTVADFSSAGPRIGDYAVKPEIAAPGRDLVAAKAAGVELGEPVGEYYMKLSGTSMAAPHVAAAAAVLAQQQPTWNARVLKSALMGTTKLPVNESVFRQGAGFLDVSRAVTQKVFAHEGSLSANLLWPHTQKAERALTYRNPGSGPLKLNLTFEPRDQNGDPAAAGVFSLPSSVTVPARSTTKVTLTIDPAKSKPGLLYHGRINATAAGVVVRTPVSAYVELETHDVTLDITDRNGNKVTGYEQGQLTRDVFLVDPAKVVETEPWLGIVPLRPKDGKWIARVRRGVYTIALHVLTPTEGGPPSSTLYAVPRIAATAPIELRLDARKANQATAMVDAADARTTEIGTILEQHVGGTSWSTGVAVSDPADEPEAYALPTPAADRRYLFMLNQVLQAGDRTYELVFGDRGAVPADPTYPVADSELADLRLVFGTQSHRPAAHFLRHLATLSDDVPVWIGHSYELTLPAVRRHLVSTSVFGVRLTWFSELTVDTATGDLAYAEFPALAQYQPGQLASLELGTAAFTPQAFGERWMGGGVILQFRPFNSSGGAEIYHSGSVQGDVVLERDGVRIATSDDPYGLSADTGAGTATFTAIMHARHEVPWSNYVPKVSGTWTFTSTDPQIGTVPLPVISTRVSGAFDGWGRAPAGRIFPLTFDITGASGEVETVNVRVSYDGENWLTVPVSDATGEWVANVRHPSSIVNPWVSLRVIVTDSAGNSAGWTAYRSYRIANLD